MSIYSKNIHYSCDDKNDDNLFGMKRLHYNNITLVKIKYLPYIMKNIFHAYSICVHMKTCGLLRATRYKITDPAKTLNTILRTRKARNVYSPDQNKMVAWMEMENLLEWKYNLTNKYFCLECGHMGLEYKNILLHIKLQCWMAKFYCWMEK